MGKNKKKHHRQLILGAGDEGGLLHDPPSDVSDYDSLDSGDEDEFDGLIDGKSTSSLPVSRPESPLKASLILMREYGDEDPAPVLPPVSKQLAKTVTKWLRVTLPRDSIVVQANYST